MNPYVRFVVPRFAPSIGGIETRAREIAVRLSKKGLRIEVCSFDLNPATRSVKTIDGVRIYRFRSIAPDDAYYLPEPVSWHWLRKNSADIIDAHNIQALPALAATFCRSGREKLLLTPHYHGEGHTPVRRMLFSGYKRLARFMVEQCDRVICVSEFERQLFERDYACCINRIVPIPNGVDYAELDKYSWKPRTESSTLLYVGRLEKYKNVGTLVEACHILRKLSSQPIKLVIVGSGPYEATLHDLIARLKLQETVTWLRSLSRDELLRNYEDTSAFVMLSEHEAYSLTVADAIALGVPVVVPSVGGLEGYVRKGIAVGVDAARPEDVAEKLLSVLQDPCKYSRRMEAKRYLSSWDDVAGLVEDLYMEMI
jgi:glycosyltransferase involved in cell wall biosynthesis